MIIERLDPAAAPEADVRALHSAWCEAHLADGEPGPPPGWRQFQGMLAWDMWTGEPAAWWWARDGGRPVAWMHLALPRADNTHAALSWVGVAPGWRRRGIGRQLAAMAADEARAAGRTVLIGECSDRTGGPAFCAAVGAEPGVRSVRRLLHLDRVPPGHHDELLADAWRHAVGYSLLAWDGPASDDLAVPVAAVNAAMNDAPMDDLDYGDECWDTAHLRRLEENAAAWAYRLVQVAVRHEATGELVGLTRVAVPEECPAWAQQWDTAVVPAHRGHRLGLVLKLEMLRRLRKVAPEVSTIETDNAASNRYMVAVNQAIGFDPADNLIAHQLRLG